MVDTKLTSERVCKLREALEAWFSEVAETLGVKLEAGTMRFSDVTVSFKVTGAVVGVNLARERWNTHAEFYGLALTDLSRCFWHRNTRYMVMDITPRGSVTLAVMRGDRVTPSRRRVSADRLVQFLAQEDRARGKA